MGNIKQTGKSKKTARKGIFRTLKAYLTRNKLGELLVMTGAISADQLRGALQLQRATSKPLGSILIESGNVSRRQLNMVLCRQTVLRTIATMMFCLFSLSPFGKKAKAEMIKDIPAAISLTQVASASFAPIGEFPAILGTDEKRSTNIKPFTKWSEMFERFEASMDNSANANVMNALKSKLDVYKTMDLYSQARSINNMMNKKRYVTDSRNWGRSDYWATPAEFMRRGGDCEDYAIAKYTALRMLGVPEERLRVAIVHDNVKDIAHAVLIVYTDHGPYILDNQTKNLQNASTGGRYRPIFSINRDAWWMHSAPKPTILASAAN